MSTFSVQAFQEKVNRLSLSQDSIETLSLWVIHHRAHAKSCVALWLDNMQKAKPERRLILFYLANDILQNGRRRGADVFFSLFREPLKSAVTLTAGSKIQSSIERMFRIWKERRIFDNAFLRELELLIEPSRQKRTAEPVTEFKISLLADALTELRKFEAELKVKSSYLTQLRVDVSNPTASLALLKDKSAGGKFSTEFDDASQKLQDYCECLGIEVNERINILEMLRECQVSQTRRLVEYQQTAQDYAQLGKMVDGLKVKLDARLKELERAQHTSTSDPSAKEDITDAGDMEIESDNDSQDSMETAPSSSSKQPPPQEQPMQQQLPAPLLLSPVSVQQPPPPPRPPLMATVAANSAPPDGFVNTVMPVYQPPLSVYQALPPSGVFSQQAPLRAFNSHPVRPVLLPPRLNATSPPRPAFSIPPSSIDQVHSNSASYYPDPLMNIRPSAQTPPPVFNSSAAPPSRFPPPPSHTRGPPGIMHPRPFMPRPRPLNSNRPPVRFPPPHMQPNAMVSRPPPPSSAFSYVQSSSAVPLPPPYSEANPVVTSLDGTVSQPSTGGPAEPSESEQDNGGSHSLDERLQNLVSQNMLDRVIDYPAEGTDIADRPYTPSAEQVIMSGAGSPVDKDDADSLPTPNTENGTPEASPPQQVNMSNPILKALYQSSPEDASTFLSSSSPSPTFPPDPHLQSSLMAEQLTPSSAPPLLASLDTGLLQSILQSVKAATSEALNLQEHQQQQPALIDSVPPINSVPPPLPSTSSSDVSGFKLSKSVPNFDNVQITASVTSALDQIFPQLSKSLMDERKRQIPEGDNPPAELPTKMQRVESEILQFPPPPPTQSMRPQFTPMEGEVRPFIPRGNPPGPRGNPRSGPPPRPNFMPRGGPMGGRGGFYMGAGPRQPRMPSPNNPRQPMNRPPQFQRPPGMMASRPRPPPPPPREFGGPGINRYGPSRPPPPPRGFANRAPYLPRPQRPPHHHHQRPEFFRAPSPKPFPPRAFHGEPPSDFRPPVRPRFV